MTLPQPPDGPWVDPRIPAPAVPEQPALPVVKTSEPRGGLVLALALACAALLFTTVGFGGAAAWLWFDRSAVAAPQPTPTPTEEAPTNAPQTVQDIEVSIVSDFEFGQFAMSRLIGDTYVSLYATFTNKDSDQAAEVFVDVTAYTEDGRILGRESSGVYLLPAQVSIFDALFSTDITEAASIKVEQISSEFSDPIMTGDVTVDSVKGADGYVEVSGASTLSQVPEYPELYIVGYVDGKVFGICSTRPDIPSNGTFTEGCYLDAVSADGPPEEIMDFPKDAEFEAYLALDIPW